MNYAVIAIDELIVLTTLAWIFWEKSHFRGPVRTTVFTGSTGGGLDNGELGNVGETEKGREDVEEKEEKLIGSRDVMS